MAKKKAQARFAWVPASHLEDGCVDLFYFDSNSLKEVEDRMRREIKFEPEIVLGDDNEYGTVYIMQIVKKYTVSRGHIAIEEEK